MSAVARVLTRSAWCLVCLAGCGAPLLEGEGPTWTAGFATPFTRHTLQVHIRVPTGPNGRSRLEEVAFQDGDLPWRPVVLLDGRAKLEVTDPDGRYGLAVTEDSSWNGSPVMASTDISWLTLGEFPVFERGVADDSPDPALEPSLTLTGLETGQDAMVVFGQQQSFIEENGGAVSLALAPGVADLMVALSGRIGRQDRVLVRRDQHLGGAMTTVDVSEAVEVEPRPFQLTGALEGDSVSLTTFIAAAASSFLTLGGWHGPPAEAHFVVLPNGLAAPGDQYLGSVNVWGTSGSRSVLGPLEVLTADGGVELPAPLEASAHWAGDGHPSWRWSPREGDGNWAGFSLWRGPGTTVYGQASSAWLRGRAELSLGATADAPVLDAQVDLRGASGNWYVNVGPVRSGSTCAKPEVNCWVAAEGQF